MDGCPERGVIVTVYGFTPWNAMLTFGVDAGPVPIRPSAGVFLLAKRSDGFAIARFDCRLIERTFFHRIRFSVRNR